MITVGTIESSALVGLGNIYLEQGEFTKAKNVFEQSLNIAREIGNKPWEAKTLNQIGRYFHRQGDYLRAQSYYEASIEIYQQLGNQLSRSRVLVDLSLLQHHLGDNLASLEFSSTALEMMDQYNRPKYIGQAQTQAGRAYAALDDLEHAKKHFLNAKENLSLAGEVNLLMEPHAGLANLFLANAEVESALPHVDEILNHIQAARSSVTDDLQDQAGAVPGLEGTHDPMWIYLVCCRVLSEGNDSRAVNILQAANELIQQQALKITDPDLHYSFLHNVKANQGIQSLFDRGGLG